MFSLCNSFPATQLQKLNVNILIAITTLTQKKKKQVLLYIQLMLVDQIGDKGLNQNHMHEQKHQMFVRSMWSCWKRMAFSKFSFLTLGIMRGNGRKLVGTGFCKITHLGGPNGFTFLISQPRMEKWRAKNLSRIRWGIKWRSEALSCLEKDKPIVFWVVGNLPFRLSPA